MFEIIKDFFRKRKLRKHISDIPTGFIPLEQIKTANFIIDVEEPGFDKVKEDILAWGRSTGIKANIYFFDFRKLGKNELLLTSIQTTLLKRELSWIGMPDSEKIAPLIEEKSDLFVSLVCNSSFPNDFLSKCTKARFKIGRLAYNGHAYDMTISGGETEELRSGIQDGFKTITEFLDMVR
jgi:hypothetical protein